VQPQQRRLCLVQHLARARPITHARRGHDDHEQRPERADPQVPLTPSDQFPAVKPPRARLISHLDALPVEDRCARLRVAPFSVADSLPPAQAAAGAGALQAAGIRYVIVHWWAFTDAQAATMRAKLAAIFPNQQPQDDPADRMAIYRLGP
jgi:hypothetical protein